MTKKKLLPTREGFLKDTLKRSQAFTKECSDKYAIVTYELAISKIAKQIQV